MPIDPAFRGLAERAALLHAEGRAGNVFNFTPEVGDYLAWFAPGVKSFIDHRYNLYPKAIATFAEISAELTDRKADPRGWQAAFQKHGIDQVALTNFARTPGKERWFAQPETWALRFGDERAMLFSWSGPARRWPGNLLAREWWPLAFGDVPPAYRAPREGPVPPSAPPDFWTTYWEGTPPEPIAAREVTTKLRAYEASGQGWQLGAEVGSIVGDYLAAATLTVGTPGAPGVAAGWVDWWTHLRIVIGNTNRQSNQPILMARDLGLPAAAVLMVRLARQAVADNPADPTGHAALAEAYKTFGQGQESYWDNRAGITAPNLRSRVRAMQVLTALRHAAPCCGPTSRPIISTWRAPISNNTTSI